MVRLDPVLSIADPLVRNIGEALGVRRSRLCGPDAGKFANSINMAGLQSWKALLAGVRRGRACAHRSGIGVAALDPQKVRAGAALYQTLPGAIFGPWKTGRHAAGADGRSNTPECWVNNLGRWLVKTVGIPLEEIGTDPHEAEDFAKRTADTGGSTGPQDGAGRADVAW